MFKLLPEIIVNNVYLSRWFSKYAEVKRFLQCRHAINEFFSRDDIPQYGERRDNLQPPSMNDWDRLEVRYCIILV